MSRPAGDFYERVYFKTRESFTHLIPQDIRKNHMDWRQSGEGEVQQGYT